ncbi:MAG: hypothetical protein K2V38_03750, partial [Gemmataceae bacterium]|nr:hypothetical protein [Gemmataceae bacterium]
MRNVSHSARLVSVVAALLACVSTVAADEPAFKVGVATKVITPEAGVWMAGYAARTKPAEGKLHDLYAKAVCLEDAT